MITWRQESRKVLQGSILGPVLLNLFIKGEGVEPDDDPKLGWITDSSIDKI